MKEQKIVRLNPLNDDFEKSINDFLKLGWISVREIPLAIPYGSTIVFIFERNT